MKAKALIIQSGMDSPAIAVARRLGIAILECSPISEAEAGIFSLRSDQRSRVSGANGRTKQYYIQGSGWVERK